MEPFPLKQHALLAWYRALKMLVAYLSPCHENLACSRNALETDLPTPLKGNKGWRGGGHRDMHMIILKLYD